MSQRITMIMSCVMAVACLAALALGWNVVAESRQVNLAILDKLNAFQAPAPEPKSLEWNRVRVKLVEGKPGGKPAAGFRVSLQGNIWGEPGEIQIGSSEKTTGADGLADLGLVRPGHYTLVIGSPWREYNSRRVTVLPGSSHVWEIVGPAGPRNKEVPIAVSVDWPDDLRDKDLWLVGRIRDLGRQVGGQTWGVSSGALWTLLVRGDKESFSYLGMYDTDRWMGSVGVGDTIPDFTQPVDTLTIRPPVAVQFQPEPLWPQSRYQLEQIVVVRGPGSDEATIKPKLNAVGSHGLVRAGLWGFNGPGLGSNWESNQAPKFQAEPGELNHWTITLPEELLETVRKQLSQPVEKS